MATFNTLSCTYAILLFFTIIIFILNDGFERKWHKNKIVFE